MGISPCTTGADGGTRTRNLLFTKQLLCQLSYAGMAFQTVVEYIDGLDPMSTWVMLKTADGATSLQARNDRVRHATGTGRL